MSGNNESKPEVEAVTWAGTPLAPVGVAVYNENGEYVRERPIDQNDLRKLGRLKGPDGDNESDS